MMHQQQVSHSG